MPGDRLNCNQCGAWLEIGPSTNYVTCGDCGSQLVVQRTSNSTYTEVLSDSDSRFSSEPSVTSRSSRPAEEGYSYQPDENKDAELEALRLENELNRLEIQWDREKEQYMIVGRYGHRTLPTKGMSVFAGLIAAGFGVFWTAMAVGITWGFGNMPANFGPPPIIRIIFPLFGVIFIIGGIGYSIYSYNKARGYEQARDRYQRERARLMEDVARARASRYR